jgi:hypothetical protein
MAMLNFFSFLPHEVEVRACLLLLLAAPLRADPATPMMDQANALPLQLRRL